jgi:hypothetical protein
MFKFSAIFPTNSSTSGSACLIASKYSWLSASSASFVRGTARARTQTRAKTFLVQTWAHFLTNCWKRAGISETNWPHDFPLSAGARRRSATERKDYHKAFQFSATVASLPERSSMVFLACTRSRSAPRLINLAKASSFSARLVTSLSRLYSDYTIAFMASRSSESFLLLF